MTRRDNGANDHLHLYADGVGQKTNVLRMVTITTVCASADHGKSRAKSIERCVPLSNGTGMLRTGHSNDAKLEAVGYNEMKDGDGDGDGNRTPVSLVYSGESRVLCMHTRTFKAAIARTNAIEMLCTLHKNPLGEQILPSSSATGCRKESTCISSLDRVEKPVVRGAGVQNIIRRNRACQCSLYTRRVSGPSTIRAWRCALKHGYPGTR